MLRVAAVQAEALPGELERNVAAAAGWVARAAERGAGLVVLPEAFTTGYGDEAFAAPLPGAGLEWTAPVQEAVESADAVVVLNTPLDHGGHRTLSSVVLRPGREPVAAYSKQHLYATEREWFEPGPQGASVDVDGIEVALSVCYDANFPEHAADAASAGAQVYVNSGAYFPGGEPRRDLHYAARALDNGVYVAFAGLLGAPHDFIGGSAIFDPEGRIVDRVEPGTEGLAMGDIDPERIAAVRAQQRMWADRRTSLGARTRP